MKIIYLGLPGTGRLRSFFTRSLYISGKYKCAWTLNLLGIDVVNDYNKNQVIEGGQSSNIQCMMDTDTLLNWEEAG